MLRSILASLDIVPSLYVRWKREYEMYSLIKMFSPDVVFQYRSAWFERQSLDAYVLSIKVGFEYQGQQHYKSVAFSGGQEAFVGFMVTMQYEEMLYLFFLTIAPSFRSKSYGSRAIETLKAQYPGKRK